MSKNFRHFILSGEASLGEIVQNIVNLSNPEMILLLSAYQVSMLGENIFVKGPEEIKLGSSYHLLVLLKEQDRDKLARLVIFLHNALVHYHNLQLTIKGIHEFNRELKAGSPYEMHIYRHAMIWYDKGIIPLSQPTS